MDGMEIFGGFADQAALDQAYNPRLTIPDAEAILGDLTAASAAVLERTPPVTQAYGPSPAEYLDIFAAASPGPAPVHMFIHGGFWRAFSARDYAFVVPPLRRAGALTVVVNYGLCPEVDLDEIARQIRAALEWTWRHIADLGGDPERITVSGHSAGAQLTAMLAATDWTARGLPAQVVRGAVGLSGIYDLEPLRHSWLQPTLQLTPELVTRNSPVRLPRPAPVPTLVAVGEQETAAFHAQSRAYAEALGAGPVLTVPGRNHITICHDLRDGGPVLEAIVRMMGLASAPAP